MQQQKKHGKIKVSSKVIKACNNTTNKWLNIKLHNVSAIPLYREKRKVSKTIR